MGQVDLDTSSNTCLSSSMLEKHSFEEISIKNNNTIDSIHNVNAVNGSMQVDQTECVNTIRILAADMVQKANSGHPGAPMGCAPMGHLLFSKHMNFSPKNPKWHSRDRFVLSNGHACCLQYSLLHLTGYSVSLDDLKSFRQEGSICPGHPEVHVTPGVEVCTGPLGQGISSAVGLAIAEQQQAAHFNKPGFDIINNYTYVICGDGCLQEGISSEASSLAGHLGLGKLIVLYDDNQITIDGSTDLSFTEDVCMRYVSYGWHVDIVDDVNDLDKLDQAIKEAKAITDKPSLIKIKTVIGHGSKNEGTAAVHGAPLGPEDIKNLKQKYGFSPEDSFIIPQKVKNYYRSAGKRGEIKEENWKLLLKQYSEKYPELGKEFNRRIEGKLADGWKDQLPKFSPKDTSVMATRVASGKVLNALATQLPELVGGSADLTPSNCSWLKCSTSFTKTNREGRNFHFGVREHAMIAVANGMFAYGASRPFVATFFAFIGYAMGSSRMSSLSNFGVTMVMTHDSIGLGEDGPTHQPIEMLASLRATPNTLVIRPADANEVTGAYIAAMENSSMPSVISLTRQNIPVLEETCANKVLLGGYTVFQPLLEGESKNDDLILVGTGSEVHLCINVAKELLKKGKRVRVVSMPSQELFNRQSKEYQLSVLPDGIPVMSIEAAATNGWQKYSHVQFGIDRFGASAPGKDLFKKFGFTIENLTGKAEEVINYYETVGQPRSPINGFRFL